VILSTTEAQLSEALSRLASWNHASTLLARAVYDWHGEWWLRDTYIGLLLANTRVYRLLNHAFQLRELTIGALAARNALELKTWIRYATRGEVNARRLYDDQMVDARDIMTRVKRLVTLIPADQRPEELDSVLENSQKLILEKGPEFNVREEDRYLRTHSLAEQAGCGAEFKDMFPILSKLVHPSAMAMFLNHSGETGDEQLLNVCNVGVSYFAQNIDDLNAHLKSASFPHIVQAEDMSLEIKGP
jgi:hypothetical protein